MVLEPLSECMLMGVCASWALEYLFGISSMGVFLMHILLWFLLDYSLLRIIEVRCFIIFSHSHYVTVYASDISIHHQAVIEFLLVVAHLGIFSQCYTHH